MGLSLAMLIGMFVLLPGAAVVFGLGQTHRPRGQSPLDAHISLSLAAALVAAMLLHGFWFALWRDILSMFRAPLPDASQVLALLVGGLNEPLAMAALKSVHEFPVRIAFYFLTLPVVSFFLGKLASGWIAEEGGAPWENLLRPEGAAFVSVTAEMNLGGACYLFTGWIDDFSVDRDGTLKRIVIGAAAMRPLIGHGGFADVDVEVNGWVPISGECVVLQMEQVKTVNLDYMYTSDAEYDSEHSLSDDLP